MDANIFNRIFLLELLARGEPTLSHWKALLAIPAFGRFSRTEAGHKLAKELFTTITKLENGTILYRFAGNLHSDDDKPAVVYIDETQHRYQCWYQHGGLHRNGDKPAWIYTNGTQKWYRHGKLHRDNDLPAVIFADGTQEWRQHGELHRDGDQPASIFTDGTRGWYRHGKLHRDGNKPTIMWANESQQ